MCDCDQNLGIGMAYELIKQNKSDVIIGPPCITCMSLLQVNKQTYLILIQLFLFSSNFVLYFQNNSATIKLFDELFNELFFPNKVFPVLAGLFAGAAAAFYNIPILVWGSATATVFSNQTLYPTMINLNAYTYQSALAVRGLLTQVMEKFSLSLLPYC